LTIAQYLTKILTKLCGLLFSGPSCICVSACLTHSIKAYRKSEQRLSVYCNCARH